MIDRVKLLQSGIYTVIEEIKNLIPTLTYAGYRFPDSYTLCEANRLNLIDIIEYKIKDPEQVKDRYVLVDNASGELKATYYARGYTLFKILNLKYKNKAKEHYIDLLNKFANNLHYKSHFDKFHYWIERLHKELSSYVPNYQDIDNMLHNELKKLDVILELCELIDDVLTPKIFNNR